MLGYRSIGLSNPRIIRYINLPPHHVGNQEVDGVGVRVQMKYVDVVCHVLSFYVTCKHRLLGMNCSVFWYFRSCLRRWYVYDKVTMTLDAQTVADYMQKCHLLKHSQLESILSKREEPTVVV